VLKQRASLLLQFAELDIPMGHNLASVGSEGNLDGIYHPLSPAPSQPLVRADDTTWSTVASSGAQYACAIATPNYTSPSHPERKKGDGSQLAKPRKSFSENRRCNVQFGFPCLFWILLYLLDEPKEKRSTCMFPCGSIT
jgi:hypothetical protein